MGNMVLAGVSSATAGPRGTGYRRVLTVLLLLSATTSPSVFAQSPFADPASGSVAAILVESTKAATPAAVEYRINGIVMMTTGAQASIRQCHALPGQVQDLDFSSQARAVVDDFITGDSGWNGVGDAPGFYLDGWARIEGNGAIVMQHVEAMRSLDGVSDIEQWCDPKLFVGGGVEPPWTVSVTHNHISLEVGYPGEHGDRRSYWADAEFTLLDNGAYRWQSAKPAMTVTVEPGSCSFGLRGGDVMMWKVTVLVPEDPVRRLVECGTRGGAPLPQGVTP